MQRKFLATTFAAALATLAVIWQTPANSVTATGGTVCSALCDSDGDFLPDTVEWTLLTNANQADTDGDETPDFVEVVEGGLPRRENPALPLDQQMRVVITGPGQGESFTWLHVFLRVVSLENAVLGSETGIEAFSVWLELPYFPGFRFPLDVFGGAGTVFQVLPTAEHGVWMQLSVPLASESILMSLLPCTLYAESTIDGHQLRSGMKLIHTGSEISTLVPWETRGRYVLQAITSSAYAAVAAPPGTDTVETNQVCVLDLAEVGQGPGGTVYEVTAADCEDANELECSSSCSASVGWVLTIPGGASLIGGN